MVLMIGWQLGAEERLIAGGGVEGPVPAAGSEYPLGIACVGRILATPPAGFARACPYGPGNSRGVDRPSALNPAKQSPRNLPTASG